MQKMFKQFMLVTAVAAAASVCAQETTIPSMSEMRGDFIVLNSQSYNGVKSLASMKPFTIEPADNDSIYTQRILYEKLPRFQSRV